MTLFVFQQLSQILWIKPEVSRSLTTLGIGETLAIFHFVGIYDRFMQLFMMCVSQVKSGK